MKIAINILASLLLSINLNAQTTYYVKNGGNNNGGLDEANAFSSVRNAMEVVSDGDKIIVTGPVSQSIQCGIYKSVTIEGQNGAEIMPLGASRDRLFIVTSSGKTITFKNITFKDANTAVQGGAIYLKHDSDLLIQDCSFINNSTDPNPNNGGNGGGAIWAGETGNLTITNSLFKGNTAVKGGAIHIEGSNRTFVIDKCTFIENFVYSDISNGGAISTYGENTSQSTIKNSTFFKNKAAETDMSTERGGSISIKRGGLLTIENCLFYENKVYPRNGDMYISDINVEDPYLAQLSLSYSIISAINGSTDTVDGISYSNTLIGADLSASNLRFDETLKKVVYDSVNYTEDSPIDFGSDGNDVGAWNSGLELSNSENINKKIVVFPNPSSDYIMFLNKPNISSCNIFDITGKLVTSNLKITNDLVSIKHLRPGIYLMVIDQKHILKLIID